MAAGPPPSASFVALTLLSRTMTVAYMPGLVLAAGTQFLVGAPGSPREARNLAIAVGAAALVAGPWYIRNARASTTTSSGSGYGEGAEAVRAPLSSHLLGVLDEGASSRPL